MFTQMDAWLIENIFEKFSHWWQKTVSHEQDCFWWAKISIIGMLVLTISAAITEYLFKNEYNWLFASGLAVVTTPFFLFRVHRDKKETYAALREGTSNSAKINQPDFLFRMFYLFYGIGISLFYVPRIFLDRFPDNVLWLSLIFLWVLCLLFFYFLTCDPLPPGSEKSRLQKWAASMKEKLAPSPAPVLNPAS
ncbi:MAG: hypothetical protein HYT93_00570 [Parcubacteria group bacterium]|nr:hypothetical protein [Parcubacteria group bacterium]